MYSTNRHRMLIDKKGTSLVYKLTRNLLTTNLSGCAWIAISQVSFFSNGNSGWSLSSPPHSPPEHEFLMVQFSWRRGLKWKAMSLPSSPPVRKLIANLLKIVNLNIQSHSIIYPCPITQL